MNESIKPGRRTFLRYVTTTSGLLLGGRALGQVKPPCPPTLSVEGGESSSAPLCNPDAEADWQSRTSGSGVVWYHDFRSDAEVSQFRWNAGYGTDPGDLDQPGAVTRITTDGITGGGCLQIQLPANEKLRAQWWRPFSPLRSPGNGRSTDDPAARGSIPLKTWAPPQGGSVYTASWKGGNYAHIDYHNPNVGDGAWEEKDGTDFWVQLRIKLDPRFTQNPSGNLGGKLLYFSRVEQSLTAQEIVPNINRGPHSFRMYHAGSPGLDNASYRKTPIPAGQSPDAWQPGSEYGNCEYPDINNASECWIYPYGEWFTLLFHVIPGHENDGGSSYADTGVQVFAARQGETRYTKIWERLNYAFDFQNGPGWSNGWNALILSNWHNSWAGGTPLWIRYDQIIFSKEFIECPQV